MSLEVQLRGARIGMLFHAGDHDLRLAYAPDVVASIGRGRPLLSVSLPAREEPFGPAETRSYVEGLLPGGARRRRLERDLGPAVRDGFDLVARLGRDCAGAVVFLPVDVMEPTEDGEVGWLAEEALEALVAGPPGPDASAGNGSAGFCLSGENHKLALVREDSNGRWALPTADVPSTHVIKPETGIHPDLVANERFCTEVVGRTGLPVVATEVATLGGRTCLLSERFDRGPGGGPSQRLHQEDLCQALGLPPRHEAPDDGPGFAEASALLRTIGRPQDVPMLLAAAVCNYILGNGDAHGENFSIIFDGDGQRLAPFYDIVSTLVYDAPDHAGMVIADEYDDRHPSLIELARCSEEADFDFVAFRRLTGQVATALGDCLGEVAEQARAEGWHAPVVDEITALAEERAFGLRAEVDF